MKPLIAVRSVGGLFKPDNAFNNFVMPAILSIGLGLRLLGIRVGLPDAPDPREALIAQDVLNLIHFTAPPEIYNWPGTAWFYLIALIGKLLTIGGFHLTEARVIWIARLLNTLLSTTTLWLTYRLGWRCYNRHVGQIAAGFLAVAMLHATNESRFALVDIPATFCVTLFLSILAGNPRLTFKTAVGLGIVAGIGFAVKFTTVFAGFSLLIFVRTDNFYRRFATIIGVSALTFTFLCPYWFIDLVSPEWNLFFEDFWYEATHYHLGHFGLFATADTSWVQRFIYLWTLLKWGLGWPLTLLVSCGVICAIAKVVLHQKLLTGSIWRWEGTLEKLPMQNARKRMHLQPVKKKWTRLLLAFIIPYLLFIGAHKVTFTRHLLILYPVLTILAAAALSVFKKRTAIGIGGAVVLYSFVYTAAFSSVLMSQPTGIEMSEWVSANIPQEESISRSPEILFDWLLPELDRELTDEEAEWALLLLPNSEVFQRYAQHPHRYQKQDWYPLVEIDMGGTLAFYERILAEGGTYELRQIFRRTPNFLGIRISDSNAPFPMCALAHPEIHLYRRRD